MKACLSKSMKLSILTVGCLSMGLIGISRATETSTTSRTTSPEGIPVTTTTIHQSDDLDIGDPLGNGPMTSKANAGPALTRRPYPEGCREDRCVRAEQRQSGPTSWEQDLASGLNMGFGAGK